MSVITETSLNPITKIYLIEKMRHLIYIKHLINSKDSSSNHSRLKKVQSYAK